jgi:hypothetical protein
MSVWMFIVSNQLTNSYETSFECHVLYWGPLGIQHFNAFFHKENMSKSKLGRLLVLPHIPSPKLICFQ